MAVSSIESSVSYAGNNSAVTAYVVPFKFEAASHLTVIVTDEDGVREELTLDSDYSVTGANNDAGGEIVTDVAVPATSTVLIERHTPPTNPTDWNDAQTWRAATLEGNFDRLSMAIIDLDNRQQGGFARTVRVPAGETLSQLAATASRLGKYLGFDPDTGDIRLVSAATILAESGGAPDGVGLPPGGLPGQGLRKSSAADADADWGWHGSILIMGPGIDYTGATDSTAAVHELIADAKAAGIYRGEFLAGTLKVNLAETDGTFSLRGQGTALDGVDPPLFARTVLIPDDDTEPVVYFEKANSGGLSDVQIEGSAIGLKVGNGSLFAGISATFKRIRVIDCDIGVQTNFCVGLLFEHVHCNYCGWGWQLLKLSDTCQLKSCGANYWTTGGINLVNSAPAVGSIRSLLIIGGEWGNGNGPWIEASSSHAHVHIIAANVESIEHPYLISTDYVSFAFDSVRIDVTGNTDQVSFIRQTAGNAQILINNPIWGGGTPGYLWEGVTGMVPPTAIGHGVDSAVFRWATDNTFASTASTVTVAKARAHGAQAYKTASQAIPTGAYTTVTWGTEVTDTHGCFNPATGLFTVPAGGAGWYAMDASFFMVEANTGEARIAERYNGSAGTIKGNLLNYPAYKMISGIWQRYLNAGDTWGCAIWHDRGSDSNVYGSGSGIEGGISIVKISP